MFSNSNWPYEYCHERLGAILLLHQAPAVLSKIAFCYTVVRRSTCRTVPKESDRFA